jgi:hypothetical protein
MLSAYLIGGKIHYKVEALSDGNEEIIDATLPTKRR